MKYIPLIIALVALSIVALIMLKAAISSITDDVIRLKNRIDSGEEKNPQEAKKKLIIQWTVIIFGVLALFVLGILLGE